MDKLLEEFIFDINCLVKHITYGGRELIERSIGPFNLVAGRCVYFANTQVKQYSKHTVYIISGFLFGGVFELTHDQ